MRTPRKIVLSSLFAALITATTATAIAQEVVPKAPTPVVAAVEVTHATTDIFPGQKVKFTAVAKDAAGNVVTTPPTTWFAAPFDLAGVDDTGTVSFFSPGEVLIGAIVGGKPHFTKVMVKAGPVTQVEIAPVQSVVVGATSKLDGGCQKFRRKPAQRRTCEMGVEQA